MLSRKDMKTFKPGTSCFQPIKSFLSKKGRENGKANYPVNSSNLPNCPGSLKSVPLSLT